VVISETRSFLNDVREELSCHCLEYESIVKKWKTPHSCSPFTEKSFNFTVFLFRWAERMHKYSICHKSYQNSLGQPGQKYDPVLTFLHCREWLDWIKVALQEQVVRAMYHGTAMDQFLKVASLREKNLRDTGTIYSYGEEFSPIECSPSQALTLMPEEEEMNYWSRKMFEIDMAINNLAGKIMKTAGTINIILSNLNSVMPRKSSGFKRSALYGEIGDFVIEHEERISATLPFPQSDPAKKLLLQELYADKYKFIVEEIV